MNLIGPSTSLPVNNPASFLESVNSIGPLLSRNVIKACPSAIRDFLGWSKYRNTVKLIVPQHIQWSLLECTLASDFCSWSGSCGLGNWTFGWFPFSSAAKDEKRILFTFLTAESLTTAIMLPRGLGTFPRHPAIWLVRHSGLNEISSDKVCARVCYYIFKDNVLQLFRCFFQRSLKMTNKIAVVRATCTAPTNIAVIKYCRANSQTIHYLLVLNCRGEIRWRSHSTSQCFAFRISSSRRCTCTNIQLITDLLDLIIITDVL